MTNRFSAVRGALFTACGLIVAMPALAAPVDTAAVDPALYTQHSLSVPFHDLDLTTDTGRATLDRRLSTAVRSVCGSSDLRDLSAMTDINRCRAEARKDADAMREVALAQAGKTDKLALSTVK